MAEKQILEQVLGIKNMSAEARAALMSHLLTSFNQATPFGDQQIRIGPDGRPVVQQTLSPGQQALLDQQQRLSLGAGQQALGQMGQLPGLFRMPDFGGMQLGQDFGQQRQAVEQAQFDRMMGLMRPEFDRQQGQLQQRLANQGLPQASRAHIAETGRFEDTRNRAMEQAALASVLAGGQEQSRLFGDTLAGRGQLMGEAQVANQMPFMNLAQLMAMQQGGVMPPTFLAPGGVAAQADQRTGGGGIFRDILGGVIGAGGKIGAAAVPHLFGG